ncbi:MAG: isoprenylcysteine carboxylmethyltransferase family protein [Spirochaetales bacterium]|nr:isoprenylcysteine carboxylmethyltransferase family protein [Spirochaetales bacterium]
MNKEDKTLSIWQLIIKALGIFIFIIILWLILVLTAGNFFWTEALLLSGAYGISVLVFMIIGYIKFPDLMKERTNPGKNVKPWDLLIMRAVYPAVLIAQLIVCALDAQRFHWTTIPVYFQITGAVLFVITEIWTFYVVLSNPFASSVVRIQNDRNQKVISTGPYKLVRHPMYLGLLLLFFAIPLFLESQFGLAFSVLLSVIFVIRTKKEDDTLKAELDGYQDYCQKTKKRLIPGIW